MARRRRGIKNQTRASEGLRHPSSRRLPRPVYLSHNVEALAIGPTGTIRPDPHFRPSRARPAPYQVSRPIQSPPPSIARPPRIPSLSRVRDFLLPWRPAIICAKRKIRREVLFATGRSGKGAHSPKSRNLDSQISCR